AATNSDLKREIAAGTFREDLFYRLNVVPIRLPALRERAMDIAPLAQHFVEKFNQRLKKQIVGMAPEVEQVLQSYAWPGNIRELDNVIERAVLFCDSNLLTLADVPLEIRNGGAVEAQLPESASSRAPESASDGLKEQVKAATSRLE